MKEKSKSNRNNIKTLNLAEFSPTFFNIVYIFNDLRKIMQKPEKKLYIGEDLIREKKRPKIQNSPEKCPFCDNEGGLELDNNSLIYDGNCLEIPAICDKCGKKCFVIYNIEFEHTEGIE